MTNFILLQTCEVRTSTFSTGIIQILQDSGALAAMASSDWLAKCCALHAANDMAWRLVA